MTPSSSGAVALVMGDVDLVRPLALAGISCAVFATETQPVRHSRLVCDVLPWIDHWERQEQLADALSDWASKHGQPPVLFPQTDGDLLTVSRYRERLAEHCRFLVAEEKLVEALTDKAAFVPLAERLGLPIPPTRRLRPGTHAADDVDLRFPVVVKPAMRNYARWAVVEPAAKALHLETPAQLAALWPALADTGLEILVQEAVPGDERRVESHHAYVDASGAVAAEFTGRKIRTLPARYGHSTALEITDQPDVAAMGREVLGALGLRGLAKVDFKRGPDGRLHLLEVNPRATLWHHPAALGGLNLPAMVHADLTGAPRPPAGRARPGTRWVLPMADLRAARANGVGVGGWLRFLAASEARSGLMWADPLPFAASLWNPVQHRLRVRLGRA